MTAATGNRVFGRPPIDAWGRPPVDEAVTVAVILAAGCGHRLGGAVGDRPKCLACLGGRTLIERQIDTLRECGVREIAVVAGYRSHDVRQVCGRSVAIVHNERYASTNSLFSLWLAGEWLARRRPASGLVMLNGDVLFHPQLLSDLLTARDEDALLVCPREVDELSDEDMKVSVRRGRVAAIDKGIAPEDADGESLGIAKFGVAGAQVLLEETRLIVSRGGAREWVPRAFSAFIRRRPLYVVGSRGYPWIEIDFPEDYWRACRDVLPAIETARVTAAPHGCAARVAPTAAALVEAGRPGSEAPATAGDGRLMRHV